MMLCFSRGATAFTAKKLDPRSRSAFKAAVPAMGKEREEPSSLPASGTSPAFALPHPGSMGVSMAPAVYNEGTSTSPAVYNEEDEDDDELFSYGTALVSCVVSLALGFTLGYGT